VALNSTTSLQRKSFIIQRIVDGGKRWFEKRIVWLLVRIFFGIIKEPEFPFGLLGKPRQSVVGQDKQQ
jgi:hypothetical protein